MARQVTTSSIVAQAIVQRTNNLFIFVNVENSNGIEVPPLIMT